MWLLIYMFMTSLKWVITCKYLHFKAITVGKLFFPIISNLIAIVWTNKAITAQNARSNVYFTIKNLRNQNVINDCTEIIPIFKFIL